SGFGVPFEWDVPLVGGYRHQVLNNISRCPSTDRFFGCRTPEIGTIIEMGHFDAFLVSGWHSFCYWQAMRACRRTHTPLLVRGDSQLPTVRSPLRRLIKHLFYRS